MNELVGSITVVDTDTSYIYIGTLESINPDSFCMSDVDVHDRSDLAVSKEKYILERRRTGVTENRSKVYVLREHVVSLSAIG